MIASTNGHKTSINEANERDPYNNNSYGTLVDQKYKLVNLPVLDVNDFNERIIRGYTGTVPLADGWRERVPLHQLHPLLVHACLFGGSYASGVRAAARAALGGF